jgi:general secretion pathway protein G
MKITRQTSLRAGFTLVEMLVVIAIIVVLMGMSIKGIQLVLRIRDESKARTQITLLAAALDNYKATYGVYPPGDGSAESSTVLRTELYPAQGAVDGDKVFLSQLGQANSQGWGGTGPVLDPFKNIDSKTSARSAYRYRSPGVNNVSDFDLWSFGEDGVEGTGDDLTNWTK